MKVIAEKFSCIVNYEAAASPNFVPPLLVTKLRQAVSASITEQRPLERLVHICKNTDIFI